MAFRKRREALRLILTGSVCIRPGSVYDATSIRIAQDLGFAVGMFGGSVASLAVLGDPDIALITLTELAEQMRRMSRAAQDEGRARRARRCFACHHGADRRRLDLRHR
jgi:carboxyvinyl-carboxyphosphonate phosphorylmutase